MAPSGQGAQSPYLNWRQAKLQALEAASGSLLAPCRLGPAAANCRGLVLCKVGKAGGGMAMGNRQRYGMCRGRGGVTAQQTARLMPLTEKRSLAPSTRRPPAHPPTRSTHPPSMAASCIAACSCMSDACGCCGPGGSGGAASAPSSAGPAGGCATRLPSSAAATPLVPLAAGAAAAAAAAARSVSWMSAASCSQAASSSAAAASAAARL